MELVFLGLIVTGAGAVGWIYNGLVRARNLVDAAWADVDVQLQRRHDLVPRLVEVVRGYARHERDTLERVLAQRERAINAQAVEERSQIEEELDEGVHRLIAIAEAYPDLKAGENFIRLQRDLVTIENDLQYARRFYNGATRDYNTRIERFPDLLVAQPFSFLQRPFFQAELDARSAPRIGEPSP